METFRKGVNFANKRTFFLCLLLIPLYHNIGFESIHSNTLCFHWYKFRRSELFFKTNFNIFLYVCKLPSSWFRNFDSFKKQNPQELKVTLEDF